MSDQHEFSNGDHQYVTNGDTIEIPARGRPKKKDNNSQEIDTNQYYHEKQNHIPMYGRKNDLSYGFNPSSTPTFTIDNETNKNPSNYAKDFSKNEVNMFHRNSYNNYPRNNYNGFNNVEQNAVDMSVCRTNNDFTNQRGMDVSQINDSYGPKIFFEDDSCNVSSSTNTDGYNIGIDPKQIFTSGTKNIHEQPIQSHQIQQHNFRSTPDQMQPQPQQRSINLGGLPNEYFMHGNPWLNRKKRKNNPLLWQYMQQNKDFHPGLIHPRQYSSIDYVQGMDRSQKMFLGCVKRSHAFPDKSTPNYTVLPLFLNSTSYYENHIQNQEFEKIASVFMERTRNFDYENVTVQQLKILMKEFGLNHTGKKSELIDRVKSSLSTLKRKLYDRKSFGMNKQKGFSEIDKPNTNVVTTPTLSTNDKFRSGSIKNSTPFSAKKPVNAGELKKTNIGTNEKYDMNRSSFGDPNSYDDYLFF